MELYLYERGCSSVHHVRAESLGSRQHITAKSAKSVKKLMNCTSILQAEFTSSKRRELGHLSLATSSLKSTHRLVQLRSNLFLFLPIIIIGNVLPSIPYVV
jgi:hypothetical protein